MGTLRQKMLANEIKKVLKGNIDITGGEIVEKCRYGKGMKVHPGVAIDTPGVKEELQKIGIDVDEVDSVVKGILKKGKKDENKLKAADLLYKRTGSYANEKKVADAFESILKLHSEIEDEQTKGITEEMEKEPDFVYQDDVELEPATD
jgi:hypothetical protein